MARSVAVLGAGIVGISCALHLHRRGFEVTLVDRREPGSETSFGNSGVIGRASIAPLSQPAIWRKLPRYAANRDRAVRFGPGYPARELGWFVRFLANSRPGAFDANARHLNALLSHALGEHEALLAGDSGLLRRDGWLQLFRTEAGFEASAGSRALWYRHGVRFRILDRDALRELEPHLGPVFERAIWLTDIASVADPGEVCRRLADRFAAEGGTLLREEVRALRSVDGRGAGRARRRRAPSRRDGGGARALERGPRRPARLSAAGHPGAGLSPAPLAAPQRAARAAVLRRGRRLRDHPDAGGASRHDGHRVQRRRRPADPGAARVGAPSRPGGLSHRRPGGARAVARGDGPGRPTRFPSSAAPPAIRTSGSRSGTHRSDSRSGR